SVTVGSQWQRYLFRVKSLPHGRLEHPRLRIEPLGPGPLWIDDVEIGSQRLSPEETLQLTKTVSAAKLAWHEHRYAECQRLLDGYWGQLLAIDPRRTPTTTAAEDPKPRAGSRVKSLFKR